MHIRWLAILGCLLITACSDTATETTMENAESKSPSEKFEMIENRFETARSEFMKEYQAATESERPKLIDEKLPKAEDYAQEFLDLALEYPDAEAAVDSLVWIAGNVRDGDTGDKALDTLFTKYIDSEGLSGICTSLGYSMPSQKVEDRLNRLINDSPHDSVKAAATNSLAYYLKSMERSKKYVEENPDTEGYSDDQLEYIRSFGDQSQMVEALYQTLISDYAELKPTERSKNTYKEMAERALYEINFLSIGKVAPNIEGEDFDGTKFKLSDYRGKVVVLDFWGDW